MEPYTNEQQQALEKAFLKFMENNRELILDRIMSRIGLDITAAPDKDINLRTYGTGKAYYNDVEIVAGGGEGNYLWRYGGNNTMLQNLSMGTNKSIVSMITGRNWDYVTDDEGLCKSDIVGVGGFMTKAQSPVNVWDLAYGLKLPRGLDASKSATPEEGATYWATDTDKLYIGKGNDLWQEIGTGAAVWGAITGTLSNQTDLQNALNAKLNLSGSNIMSGNLSIEKTDPAVQFKQSGTWRGKLYTTGNDMVALCELGNLYLSTADSTGGSVLLETKGVTHMKIDPSGNVGIGTTNPNEPLEVAKDTGARFIVSNGGGANRKAILLQAPGTVYGFGRILAHDYNTRTGMNLVLQDSGGNVGIGTTSPGRKLEVNGEIGIADSNTYLKNNAGDMELHVASGKKIKIVVG